MSSTAFGQAFPEPPGPHCPLSATEAAAIPSFRTGDRIAATYYFYWYKWKDACAKGICDPAYTRGHILFATGVHEATAAVDALTDHPADIEQWDFEDPAWHSKQLSQIVSASIEVILPVFWGVPGRYGRDGHSAAAWSMEGLKALSTALEQREREGKQNPRVGMFYDTSTLTFESAFNYPQGHKADLTTDQGKKHFYVTIRDFFSLVPPRYWALWEGRPLVWLYAAEWAGNHDAALFPYVREMFAREFGGLVPHFAGHVDWGKEGLDWVYRWGGAIQPSYLSVSSIGPGFDNSGALGKPRGSSISRDRQDGEFYKAAWERALRSPAPWVVLETWNELHEGTEICPTQERGEEYLRITGDYIRALKKPGETPPLPGPFQGAALAEWKGNDAGDGLEPVKAEDGIFRKVSGADGLVLEMASPYLYFAVDDSFCFATNELMTLEIEYFDLPAGPGSKRSNQPGSLRVEYDSWDRETTLHGIYKTTESSPLSGRFGWRKASFDLKGACLANNQNEGADFRIVGPKGFRIRKVTVKRS